MMFQLTILQLFSFEGAKDADNSLLEARGKDISICLIFFSFYFQISKMCGCGLFSSFFHLYCFPFNLFVKHITSYSRGRHRSRC